MRTEWLSIIGPELAAITRPERFNNGRLTLLVESSRALEVQHMSDLITTRINTYFGRNTVRKLAFLQGTLIVPPTPPKSCPHPSPGISDAELEKQVARVEDPQLRDALRELGRGIASTPDD